MTIIDTTLWGRSSNDNWTSPTPTSLKTLKNLNHDYIVSDTTYSNYVISSDVTTLENGDNGLGVVFDFLDNNNYKYIMYQGGGLISLYSTSMPPVALFEVVNGTHVTLLANNTFSYWQKNSTFSIKLENVFDDVVFYVNEIEAIRYKKDNAVSGKIGFVTHSQICEFDNIELYQSNTNRVKAKFVLYAVNNSEKLAEIEVKQNGKSDTFVEIEPRVIGGKAIYTEIFAIYRGNSEILTEIQPLGYNALETEIEVRPHNRMKTIWEVQQPPIITDVFNPTQDTFTREKSDFATINYGGSSSMVAGNSSDDIWRSFIQFNLSSINPSYVLVNTKLRLYHKGVVPTHLNLELFNADNTWSEYNTTNLNRPTPIKLITDDFVVKNGYVEFDVLDIVKDWVALNTINNGFILSVSNETKIGQATFYTRESLLPPELVVSYYDSRIFSQGRSQIITEMFVYSSRNSNVNTEITVDSVYSFTKQDVELYVHRKEVPIPNDILTEITASKPNIHTEFIVTIHVEDDILTEIYPRIGREHRVNTEISVSRSVVETEVSSRLSSSNDIATELSVNRDVVLAEIGVYRYSDSEILTELETIRVFSSKVLTEILVSKDTSKTEISVRVGRLKDLYTQISVTRPLINSEINVKYRSEILVEIEANIKSDIVTEITSNKPNVEAEIGVFGYESKDVYTEIFVSYTSAIGVEVDVKKIGQVEAEIDIKKVSQTDVEIVTNKNKVYAEIVIPTWVDYDLLATIEPRILMVNNIYTIIQVSGKGGAYAFII